jgi:hypothetical protein
MKIINILVSLLIAGIILYVGSIIFIQMVKYLWELNPLTSIGFIISVVVAIIKGSISFEKLEDNLGILCLIFGGTILSYLATSQIHNLISIALAGDLVGAFVMGIVILLIWFKGQEMKG